MSFVFFDLEWNQGYPRSETERIDEIIQLGAIRLDSWEGPAESFSACVRPTIHHSLHHQVRKLLPLTQQQLRHAAPFPTVIRSFFQWCGEDAVFFTWGTSDARVLDCNLVWYGLEEYLSLEIRDLQRAFDLQFLGTNQQMSLKGAVETLALEDKLTFHDAGNDAYYTACIAQELVRRWGRLPTEAELDRLESDLIRRHREESQSAALTMINDLLTEDSALMTRRIGPALSLENLLKGRSARVFSCPVCDTALCSGSWYCLGDFAVARTRCGEHGRFYSLLQLTDVKTAYRGLLRVYPEAAFSRKLFGLCRSGGELISVKRIPRKKKRSARRSGPPLEGGVS